MYINNCSYKRKGILFKPNKVDQDQMQRTGCLCKSCVHLSLYKIPDLTGIGISQDLTKNRSKIAYLARQAVKQKQTKSTSVRDGKIFITDKADNRKIITCEVELNAILNTDCVNQDGTFNINLSIPPPQSHGMFVVRPPSPALLSQQGIPLGLPQIPCQPHMLNQFMPNMFGSQLM